MFRGVESLAYKIKPVLFLFVLCFLLATKTLFKTNEKLYYDILETMLSLFHKKNIITFSFRFYEKSSEKSIFIGWPFLILTNPSYDFKHFLF